MQNVLSLQLFPPPSAADPCLQSTVSCDSHTSCESHRSTPDQEEIT
jgi:hypothetical protein